MCPCASLCSLKVIRGSLTRPYHGISIWYTEYTRRFFCSRERIIGSGNLTWVHPYFGPEKEYFEAPIGLIKNANTNTKESLCGLQLRRKALQLEGWECRTGPSGVGMITRAGPKCSLVRRVICTDRRRSPQNHPLQRQDRTTSGQEDAQNQSLMLSRPLFVLSSARASRLRTRRDQEGR